MKVSGGRQQQRGADRGGVAAGVGDGVGVAAAAAAGGRDRHRGGRALRLRLAGLAGLDARRPGRPRRAR